MFRIPASSSTGAEATGRPPFGSIRFVDAGYVAAMGIPIRRGRAFTAAEARNLRDRVIVINDTMARHYWPERDPDREPAAADRNGGRRRVVHRGRRRR